MERNIYENLSENLYTLRKSRGYTQVQLGEILNYSDKSVSKWETGESLPNLETLLSLSELYNVSIDELLTTKIESESVIGEEAVRNISKMTVALLCVTSVWFIAACIFSLFLIKYDGKSMGSWMAFIWAVPISLVVLIVFSSIWFRKYIYLIVSLFIWTLLVSIFLQFLVSSNYENVYFMIIVIGVPLQVTVLLTKTLRSDVTKRIAKRQAEAKQRRQQRRLRNKE